MYSPYPSKALGHGLGVTQLLVLQLLFGDRHCDSPRELEVVATSLSRSTVFCPSPARDFV